MKREPEFGLLVGSFNLPAELEALVDLALDLRWTVRGATDDIWKRLDPEAWEKTKNPYLILQNVPSSCLIEASKDERLIGAIKSWKKQRDRLLTEPGWFEKHHDVHSIAYFSMEFGLSEALPIYSGGLGILAGDHLKTASDLGVPITGVASSISRATSAKFWARTEPRWRPSPTTIRLLCRWCRSWMRTEVGLGSRSGFLEGLYT
jgi:hypothetical protein